MREHALRGEVEVQVDDRLRFAARPLGESVEQPHERVLELGRGIALEPLALEARHQHLRLVAGNDDVRLERLEASFDDLASRARSTSSYDASFGVPVTSHARARVVPQCDQ